MTNRRTFLGASVALAALSTVPAFAGMMKVREGTFSGRSNHVTSGSVQIIEEDGRYFVELGDDFELDNGPDPRVAFGKDGTYDPETKLGALLNLKGKQRYAVPSVWDHNLYNEVYIWCDVASVPLGVAPLN
jgi:hypothetical protein